MSYIVSGQFDGATSYLVDYEKNNYELSPQKTEARRFSTRKRALDIAQLLKVQGWPMTVEEVA
jgi:hypothetical protein